MTRKPDTVLDLDPDAQRDWLAHVRRELAALIHEAATLRQENDALRARLAEQGAEIERLQAIVAEAEGRTE